MTHEIKIGGIANTAFKPGGRRGPAHAGNRLLVVLADGLSGPAKQAALQAIRAHDDVTVARVSGFGIVQVSTKPGTDGEKTAERLKQIDGVKHAGRAPLYDPARKRRPEMTL